MDTAGAATQILLDTERSKDHMLARIEALTTWEHVHQIEQELKALVAHTLPTPTPRTA